MSSAAGKFMTANFLLRMGAALAILGFGVYITETGVTLKLMAFALALFAIPVFGQFTPWPLVQAYTLSFGVFLVVQSLLSPFLLGDAADLIAHPPNFTAILEPRDGNEHPARITTDGLGFRASPRVDYAHKRGFRIFAIGGSTTEEMGLDDEATWTHGVQQRLAGALGRPVEVINTGVSGLRARHHLATLERILPLHPDAAVFLLGANDWNFDTYQHFGSTRPFDRLSFGNTVLGRLLRAQYQRAIGPRDVRILTRPYRVPESALRREREIVWQPGDVSAEYRANLMKIAAACRETKLLCVFLTQPNGYKESAPPDLRAMFWMTPPSATYTLTFESLERLASIYNGALIAFARENGQPVCDLDREIDATPENFGDDMHFTQSGSARVAAAVAECLKPLVAGK